MHFLIRSRSNASWIRSRCFSDFWARWTFALIRFFRPILMSCFISPCAKSRLLSAELPATDIAVYSMLLKFAEFSHRRLYSYPLSSSIPLLILYHSFNLPPSHKTPILNRICIPILPIIDPIFLRILPFLILLPYVSGISSIPPISILRSFWALSLFGSKSPPNP